MNGYDRLERLLRRIDAPEPRRLSGAPDPYGRWVEAWEAFLDLPAAPVPLMRLIGTLNHLPLRGFAPGELCLTRIDGPFGRGLYCFRFMGCVGGWGATPASQPPYDFDSTVHPCGWGILG